MPQDLTTWKVNDRQRLFVPHLYVRNKWVWDMAPSQVEICSGTQQMISHNHDSRTAAIIERSHLPDPYFFMAVAMLAFQFWNLACPSCTPPSENVSLRAPTCVHLFLLCKECSACVFTVWSYFSICANQAKPFFSRLTQSTTTETQILVTEGGGLCRFKSCLPSR